MSGCTRVHRSVTVPPEFAGAWQVGRSKSATRQAALDEHPHTSSPTTHVSLEQLACKMRTRTHVRMHDHVQCDFFEFGCGPQKPI